MSAAKIAELEARRAERLAEHAKAESSQHVDDLEARELLEDEHGFVAAVKVTRFVKGHPTRAFVKTPEPAQYKRYKDQIYKAAGKENMKASKDAQELLARSCWVYPLDAKDRDAMLESFPGLLTPIGLAAAQLAEGKQEEEGKD